MVDTTSVQLRATVAELLVSWLEAVGVRWAFGVSGGGVAPLWSALSRSERITVVHTQHESGAAFAATEASLASDAPVVVFTTTGPGLTNALTGLIAARTEGARVLVLSGVTAADRRYRGATQESGGSAPLLLPAAFDLAAVVDGSVMLGPLLQRIDAGFQRPGAFVAHLGLPTDLQGQRSHAVLPARVLQHPPRVHRDDLVDLAHELSTHRTAVVLGFEARHACAEVLQLAERLGGPVFTTPRAKGILPASHPAQAGTLGFAGSDHAEGRLASWQPERLLVLGSTLGEGASQYVPVLTQVARQISVHPGPPSSAFPTQAREHWQVPVEVFLQALLPLLEGRLEDSWAVEPNAEPLPTAPGTVSTLALFDAVQRVVIDQTDALVMAEAGNALAFAIHRLRFESPRLRVSVNWGAMGHFTTGVVGAALATGRRAVSLVGDGAMHMQQELATAVTQGADATWIVLNDSAYGMCRQGTTMAGLQGVDCQLPTTDFAALAGALGVRARRVTRAADLDRALQEALEGHGPSLVDVRIDPDVQAPIGRRIRGLTWAEEEAR